MPISYSNTLAAYAVGRRVNMEEWNTITRSLEGATALGFGQPAVAGTGAHTCVPLSATGQNILGVTEADPTLPRPGDAFAQYDTVPICESGVIGVLLGANVTRGAQARFDITNKVWTGAAASGTVLTIPGAQFDEAGSSGAVGKLRYRRPVPSVSA
ncbi:structural cement protein Gp24 [Rhizobium leguminosarum]|uniref:structural cement protein Gp24 n=1 Tax=Rhizobium leguminosarum TaxID=384 RepID=UPI002F93D498